MKLDVNELMNTALPWEVSLIIDGVEYATRRPTNLELASFRNLAGDYSEDAYKLFESFFVGTPPALRGKESYEPASIVLLTCFNGESRKNSLSISKRTIAEMEKTSTAKKA